ncbi:polyprenyl synthetase family protein [Nocardiopsis sp. EMB25]|uniref:polyprenyl synthetase family protein n=1 Tax=Nocardiopsis sp. EMB25 TaxID=2835867 RepID=UPI002284A59E|nr:polyprenyl synthetase family protein [Nocardiopsis sp. EMB25]MCY9783117.1 polyprenyl synthetase family protein [Nocardiopsis sp. EMB25]
MTAPRTTARARDARERPGPPFPAAHGDGFPHEAITSHLRDFLTGRGRAVEELDADFADEVLRRLTGFVLDGGKRTRPVFAWWGWRAGGGADDGPEATAALRAASALELVQAFALVQDDVMDQSPVRRGRPALHADLAADHRSAGWFGDPRRYGDSVALLAADLALIWAEDMFTEALAGMADARERARRPWRAMHAEMVVGQFLDLRSQAGSDDTESTPARVNLLKTASYSVERPLHLGAEIAGATGAATAGLRRYGAAIGSAYQLRDDLLDLYGDPARTGKAVGGDLRQGKRTLLVAVGLRRARENGDTDAERTLTSAIGDPGLTDADVATVADLLVDLGARQAVERRVDDLVDEGTRAVAEAPITTEARGELRRRAGAATTRLN